MSKRKKYKDFSITIPDSIEDIKLKQYIEFVDIMSRIPKESIQNISHLKVIVISIFCEVDIRTVQYGFKKKDVDEISTRIFELIAENEAFVNNGDIPKAFEIEGIHFALIPNFEDMTTAEFVDLDTYIRDWNTMHKAMAVAYRPIKEVKTDPFTKIERYSLIDYEGSDKFSDIMLEQPAYRGGKLLFFFLNSLRDLLPRFLNYINKEIKKAEKANDTQVKDSLMQSMGGIIQFTDFLTEILQSMESFSVLLSRAS